MSELRSGRAGKVAIVTGASTGIGEAAATRLAEAGFRVYGTSRRGAAGGSKAFEMLTLDVTDYDSAERLVAEVLSREGRIDLLVNNAGFSTAPAGAEESSIEQAKGVFETNFFGVVRMTRAVLPSMRRQGSGRIVNISSVFGFLPAPFMAMYAASKHAVEGYSESLDHEVRSLGIRVSLIEPANTKTRFDANLLQPDAPLEAYRDARMIVGKRLSEMMESGEEPGVVAEAVLRAATAACPRRRYASGGRAKMLQWLRRLAPAGLVDKSLRQELRLHTIPRAAPRA